MTHLADSVAFRNDWSRARSSIGAASGLLLLLVGISGAVLPVAGQYIDPAFALDTAGGWRRFWTEVLPGIAVAVGGLLMLAAGRGTSVRAGWVTVAAGAWFIAGPLLAPPWPNAVGGSPGWMGFYQGLGSVTVFVAAGALGGLAVHEEGPPKAGEAAS
jgi:hypothetical protein